MVQSAERINKLPAYLFAEVDKKVREAVSQGVDVIRLGIGDPDQPTPDFIIRKMQEEVSNGANHCYPPDAGLWAPVPAGHTSQSFVSRVLESTGVVLTPGRGFGVYGEGYFRIALTVDVERLKEAVQRFKDAGIRYQT